jgi:FxLD family lantipeptide
MPAVQNSPVVEDELALDITVVEEGEAVHALLCSTDNGCDTQKQGDC